MKRKITKVTLQQFIQSRLVNIMACCTNISRGTNISTYSSGKLNYLCKKFQSVGLYGRIVATDLYIENANKIILKKCKILSSHFRALRH